VIRRSRLWADIGGATAIEFACLAGILAVMVLGIIDFGRGFWFRMQVQNAAQAGADWAQYNPFNCNAATSTCVNLAGTSVPTGLLNAVEFATDLSLNTSNIAVQASTGGTTCGCPNQIGTGVQLTASCDASADPCTYGNPGGYAIVTVSYSFVPLFPWPTFNNNSNTITLSGSATALCVGGATC
jgi:Flp pilus assembly protein TadG